MISWEMCPNPFTGMSGLILKCYISQSTKVSGSAEFAPRMKVKLKLMTYIWFYPTLLHYCSLYSCPQQSVHTLGDNTTIHRTGGTSSNYYFHRRHILNSCDIITALPGGSCILCINEALIFLMWCRVCLFCLIEASIKIIKFFSLSSVPFY